MIEALPVLTFFGFIIIIGFLAVYLFKKTKIPDVLLLLLLGLLINYLGLINVEMFIATSSLLSALALIIILFEAGLNMNIYAVIKDSPRSFLLTTINLIFSMLIVSALSVFLLNMDFLLGLLLGAIIGGISSPIVISMLQGVRVSEDVKTILDLESVWSDVLCIVVAITLMQMIALEKTTTFSEISNILLGTLSIGIVIGLVSGVAWLSVSKRIRGNPFEYILTLGVLFLLYVFVENTQGSGAIAVLMFGLVLGNAKFFWKTLMLKEDVSTNRKIRTLHKEISFFIKTFFFVYLGLVFSLENPIYVVFSLAVTVALLITRIISVKISFFRMRISEFDKRMTQVMMPRGLAAAVLAQLPVILYGIEEASVFSDIVFVVIIFSIIFSSLGVFFVSRRQNTKSNTGYQGSGSNEDGNRKNNQDRKKSESGTLPAVVYQSYH
ncbi:MAG: hypothetical protein GXO63_01640 [Candidatus Micrarchaeota archaeon]|nr:hypothetical protein [Candidatus Micrarchaeota archaeon]